jgi:hypothetical protein
MMRMKNSLLCRADPQLTIRFYLGALSREQWATQQREIVAPQRPSDSERDRQHSEMVWADARCVRWLFVRWEPWWH